MPLMISFMPSTMPFSEAWITDKLLAPGASRWLNTEADVFSLVLDCSYTANRTLVATLIASR